MGLLSHKNIQRAGEVCPSLNKLLGIYPNLTLWSPSQEIIPIVSPPCFKYFCSLASKRNFTVQHTMFVSVWFKQTTCEQALQNYGYIYLIRMLFTYLIPLEYRANLALIRSMWFKLLILWPNLHLVLLAGSHINKTLEFMRMMSQNSLYLATRQTGMAGLKYTNAEFIAGED